MKRTIILTLFIAICSTISIAQNKFYTTTGSEMIFSFATIDDNGNANGNIMRWSPVFNFQFYGNYDINKNLGLIFGATIRNVGFIYNVQDGTNTKKKHRNYDFGIPVGFKVGSMKKTFFFAGYEIEFPFHYKEKTFIDEQKTKFSVWFSSRTPAYYNTVFAGVQFPYGLSLKFKYYLSEFFNQNYTESNGNKPYNGLEVHVFYFSLSASLFKGHEVYVKEYKHEARVY